MSILKGSSGVGEPKYAGGIAPGQPVIYDGLGLYDPGEPDAVELGLEYDATPTPSPIRAELAPAWLIGSIVLGWVAWKIADRI